MWSWCCCCFCFKSWLSDETPSEALGESVWVYLLSHNPIVVAVAFGVVMMQWLILWAFAWNAETNMYEAACSLEGALQCQPSNIEYGNTILLVVALLLSWTLADVMMGWQFLISSFQVTYDSGFSSFRIFLVGLVAFAIGNGTFWSALLFTILNATSDLGALLDVVAILYIMDIDEAVYASLAKLAPHWHKQIVQDIQDEFRAGIDGSIDVVKNDSGGGDDDDIIIGVNAPPSSSPRGVTALASKTRSLPTELRDPWL